MTDIRPTEAAASANLRNAIFPSGPPRDGHILRLRHVASWESQFAGIGRVTALATDRLLTERHAVDDAGLTVIYLQRHRIEIGLKLILERAAVAMRPGHQLKPLVAACAQACTVAGFGDAWTTFHAAQGVYIDLMDAVDPGSMTFRYPVDRSNQPWVRDGLVDLAALEAAGISHERAVLGLIAELAALEPLPNMPDPAAVHALLLTVARAARDYVAFSEQSLALLKSQVAAAASWMGRRKIQAADGQQAAEAAAQDGLRATLELAQRVEGMAERIASAHSLGASAPLSPAQGLPPAPLLSRPLLPHEAAAYAETRLRAFVDAFAPHIRTLSSTVHAARDATREWDQPACRQLHHELARMASRLSKLAADSEPEPSAT